jgi:hypothetical protein
MKIKLFVIIIIAVLSVGLIIKHLVSYPLLHVEYQGHVTDVRFDVKGYSEFKINKGLAWYQMHYLDCDLRMGDSMSKKMDDTYIYHYRNKVLIGKYSSVLGYRYYGDLRRSKEK